MRSRNIKPSLFKNELLAVADPICTVVFCGLWCLADREGRLEDRPQKIHIEICPGRAFPMTAEALDWLATNGFIARYSVDGKAYIQVENFGRHQHPHHKEPSSTIPKPETGLGQAPDSMPLEGGQTRLIPDSGFLIPDSSPSGRDGASAEPLNGKAQKRAAKMVPEGWQPSPALLSRIEAEKVPDCLTRGGTSVEMELERFRSCTFGTPRSDWDRTAWNWLLTECKKINQKEAMHGSFRQANRK